MPFKGIVNPPKKYKYWKCRLVYIFIWTDLEKNLRYATCSPKDPLQWMGAIRMKVQTADKNITGIQK